MEFEELALAETITGFNIAEVIEKLGAGIGVTLEEME